MIFATLCHLALLCPYSSWMDVQVKGTSLPKALHCWERSLQENNHISGNHSQHNRQKHKTPPMRSCPLHLIDSCLWPYCNPTCPNSYDQQRGHEINAFQFLKHMGLDVRKMAQQQGVDARTWLSVLNSGSWVFIKLQQWIYGVRETKRTLTWSNHSKTHWTILSQIWLNQNV